MASKYHPVLVPFKGKHPYFKDGKAYSYREYSNWTFQNDERNGIVPSTMKGRLRGQAFCEPRHLYPIADFAATSEKIKKLRGYCKEARLRVLNSPRLEGKSEKMSDKWLRVKL